jgi:hypothetical protein
MCRHLRDPGAKGGGELEFVPNIGRKSFGDIESVLAGNYHRMQTTGEESDGGANKASSAATAPPHKEKEEEEEEGHGSGGDAHGTPASPTAKRVRREGGGGTAADGSALGAADDNTAAAVVTTKLDGVSSYQYETGEGELIFFRGGESLHQVRSVKGETLRMVAALQFHTSDDAFDLPDMTERIYGVPVDKHVGPKRRVVSSF